MIMLLALETSPTINTLLIGLLVPILGVLSPLLLAWQINKNARATKEQEWARQDELTARAAESLQERHKVLDEKTDNVAKLLSETTETTNNQLKKIHVLVNGQMTEAIQSELDATRETLIVMNDLIENNRNHGIEPTLEVLAAVRGRELKVKELEEVLTIREEKEKR